MLVSIVSPNLSSNCLGRAFVLAQLAERYYDVEIVGPKLGDEIWAPLRHKYDYKQVRTKSRIYDFPFSISELLDRVSGDIIYASKPRVTSYGIALAASQSRDIPLILDIDDWESGFSYESGKATAYIKEIPRMIDFDSLYYKRGMEAVSSLADAKTVSNTFLQQKFGGHLVPHAKDTAELNPSKFNKYQVRDELELPSDDFLVMFSGTPRPHKGVDDLAQAVSDVQDENIKLVIVGAHDSSYVRRIRRVGGDSVLIRGRQPIDEIPRWIAATDLVAIPQKDTFATQGQLPSKLFDAMAMAKPIIATEVNDIPSILEGCGIVTKPGDVTQLRQSILDLYSDDQLRQALGSAARKKCVEKYSYESLAPVVKSVISGVV